MERRGLRQQNLAISSWTHFRLSFINAKALRWSFIRIGDPATGVKGKSSGADAWIVRQIVYLSFCPH